MGVRSGALAGLLGVMLVACAPSGEGGGTPAAPGWPYSPEDPLRVAVVGDSLSFGDSTAFAQDGLGPGSFVFWALGDDAVLAGGTAVPGATSVEQAARVTPVEADALILALGTNDLWRGLPFARTAEALTQIAAAVPAPRVVLLSVPPMDEDFRQDTAGFNRQLRRLAGEQGWEFVDAAAAVRDGDAWAAGATSDGVHYTESGARAVGARLGEALRAGTSPAPD